VLPLLLVACGDDEDGDGLVPWSAQRTQVIDGKREVVKVAPAAGSECVDYGGLCLKPQDKCGTNGADILLDGQGRLLDFICYPGEATLSVEELGQHDGNIAQNENGKVVLLDDRDDGADITGNVSIDANGIVLYGEHADNAVIGGSLTIDGNNVLVRGARIQGNVTIVKNDAVLALCVIEGDLEIQGNNAELMACDVYGNVTVSGNNVRLFGNRIAGTVSVSGMNPVCTDNLTLSDGNGNHTVEAGEVGALRSCD